MRIRPTIAMRSRCATLVMFAALAAAVPLAALLLAARADDTARAQPPAAQRPNVVLVMTDDQTVEQMAALPRVRALIGRRGTTFANNYASYPLCCPARATLLTGQYAHNHGVLGNEPQQRGGYDMLERQERNTLPVWLRRAGYATAHVGKYLNRYGRTRSGPRHVPAGWNLWFGSVDPTTYNFLRTCINRNGRLLAYGAGPVPNCPGAARLRSVYQADLYTRRAVRFIRRSAPRRRPFFLSVGYLAPHGGQPRTRRCGTSAKPAPRHRRAFAGVSPPRPPSFDEADMSDKPPYLRRLPRFGPRLIKQITTSYRCRRESLLAVDEGVGKLVAALRRAGELDNTLFVFASDNGYFQGEHRIPAGKIKHYEPSARVPTLIRGPGMPEGRRVGSLTANIDLAATIVQAAGARPGRSLDGVSLRDLAQRPEAFADRALLLENGPRLNRMHPHYTAVRHGSWKLVAYADGRRELYDLRRDPHELDNLSGRVAVPAGLEAKLAQLRHCKGMTCRR